MFRYLPKRITRDIGNDDRRSAICRRPARTGARANWQLLHLLSPSFGKTGPGYRIQVNAIRAKQQNRSKRAGAIIFDNRAQRIQDLFQGNAGGHHLKKTLFPGEQRFPSLALADVDRGTGITISLTRRTEVGAPHPLDMLNRSIRKRDSKFQIKTAPLANCFVETLLNKGSIFRMNRLQEQLE